MEKVKFINKNLSEGKKHSCYVAAPFFDPDQVTRVALVETMLEKYGLTYFSPRKDSACEDIHNPEVRKRVFDLNCQSIKNAEFVIAITDGKDVGTMIEVGMAKEAGIPVIGVAFTLGENQLFNLMIAEACYAVSRTKEELEKILTTGEKIEYKGLIE